MSKVLFTSDMVVRTNGVVNVGATEIAFERVLQAHIVESEMEESVIKDAVMKVFEEFRGNRISMELLAAKALSYLNAQPSNSKALSERITKFVQDNTDHNKKVDRKTKQVIQEAEPRGTRLFASLLGPQGGLVCNSHQPENGKPVEKPEEIESGDEDFSNLADDLSQE